jgi:simple sugar transport system permease protein
LKLEFYIKRREKSIPYFNYISPILSIILALAISDLILILSGVDPTALFQVLYRASTNYNSIRYAIPLILCGLGLGLAYKANIWNIGGEGQILAGALAATAIGLNVIPISASSNTTILLTLILGFIAGAIIALIPGILKAYYNVNEVLSTLMLNYVMLQLVNYLVYGPWRGSEEYGYPRTNIFPRDMWYPRLTIFGITTNIPIPTLLISILASGILYYYMFYTKWGYEIRIFGANPRAADYAGINTKKIIIYTMLISGGLAGIAGAGEVMGIYRQLVRAERVSAGFGYTAIIVAWLGNLNPLGILLTGIFMGILISSSYTLQIFSNISYGTVNAIQGIILLCFVSLDFLSKYKPIVKVIRE